MGSARYSRLHLYSLCKFPNILVILMVDWINQVLFQRLKLTFLPRTGMNF